VSNTIATQQYVFNCHVATKKNQQQQQQVQLAVVKIIIKEEYEQGEKSLPGIIIILSYTFQYQKMH
jgi:hypothetical protein